jgi:hypothetical protein
MLADKIVEAANEGFAQRRRVHLVTDTLKESPISEIEHVGHGLLRYRHHGLPNDHYAAEGSFKMLSVMPHEDQW